MLEAGSGSAPQRFASLVSNVSQVLENHRCSAVVVYGDTDSSLAGALAGVKTKTPVIHIEAGCRSGDLRMQEEYNRRMIDHISVLNLAVSPHCSANLRRESVPGVSLTTGDPQFDVFLEFSPPTRTDLRPVERGFITMHRSENVDSPDFLTRLLTGLREVATTREVTLTWSVHPRTAAAVARITPPPFLRLVPPLSYRETLRHVGASSFCITDSGGLQKEAFWLRTPCITVRESTEWQETVAAGANRLCPDPNSLTDAVAAALTSARTAQWDQNPYGPPGGSSRAAQAIADAVRSNLPHHAMNGNAGLRVGGGYAAD